MGLPFSCLRKSFGVPLQLRVGFKLARVPLAQPCGTSKLYKSMTCARDAAGKQGSGGGDGGVAELVKLQMQLQQEVKAKEEGKS